MRIVKFQPGNHIKDDDGAEEIAKNIRLTVSFLWGLLIGTFGYWFFSL